MAFPSSPTNGQIANRFGRKFQFNSTSGTWLPVQSVAASTLAEASINTLSDIDLQTTAPQDGETLVWNAAQSKFVPGAASGSGTTVYATLAELPLSGNDAGSQAFVSENNRLYIWNGSGWYNIALINTAPSITSGGAGTYELASDGTPTVITLQATDPEGVPITWSYSVTSGSLTNGGGATATVSQADNVFTITPTTTSDYGGEFSLTFTASDGINIATDVNSFTLAFVSPYWKNLALSIGTSSTNGLNNTTIVDRSTNGFTVSRYGESFQSAFNPYLDNWCFNFDGVDDYLTVPSGITNMGSGDFTIEAWIKFYDTTSCQILDTRPNSTNGAYLTMGWSTTGLGLYSNTANQLVVSTSLATNVWHHIALVRSGSTTSYYANGINVGDTSFNPTYLEGVNRIGGNAFVGENNGAVSISNFRIVKGTAVYTSNFTPPTEKLTAISGTSLLIGQSNRFKDESSNNHLVTIVGNPRILADNPFGQGSVYASGENIGSVYLDGSGDYLTIPDNPQFDVGANFTAEFWFYSLNNTGDRVVLNQWKIGGRSWLMGPGWISVAGSMGQPSFTLPNYDATQYVNQWFHMAWVKNGNTNSFYVNGVLAGSVDGSITASSNRLMIGANDDSGSPVWNFNGYVADLRITQTAVYTSAFTPPTAPVGNTNASLYLPFDNVGVYDKTGSNPLILSGNTTTSTTQTKYADTSLYFDGSGDYINVGDTSFGNLPTDFTLEGWYNFSALSTNRILIDTFLSGVSDSWQLYWRGTGSSISFWVGSGTVLQDPSASTITTNTWYHIAVCRSGSTIKLFIDGNEKDSATLSTDLSPNRSIDLGRQASTDANYFQGYMEDVQIIKGLAKYTTNFTPPTQTQGKIYQAES